MKPPDQYPQYEDITPTSTDETEDEDDDDYDEDDDDDDDDIEPDSEHDSEPLNRKIGNFSTWNKICIQQVKTNTVRIQKLKFVYSYMFCEQVTQSYV